MTDSLSSRRLAAKLERLVGLRVWVPGIAAGMLTLSFGAPHTRRNSRGVEVTGGELSLHVQCAWRLVRGDEIVVGLSDYNYADDENEAIAYIHGRVSDALKDAPTVTSVSNVRAGGFSLELSDGMFIEAFPSLSLPDADGEFWRMFSSASSAPHFVVGSGEAGVTDG